LTNILSFSHKKRKHTAIMLARSTLMAGVSY
jgi:hypothetical protein